MGQLGRQRGFAFERYIVKEFEGLGWIAQRLGGPNQPDVLARNWKHSRSYIIEAKSGYASKLHVPQDQIQRQIDWVERGIMKCPLSLLAFKFAKGRKPTYRYWLMPRSWPSCGITCEKDGTVTRTEDGEIRGFCEPSLEKLIARDKGV